MVCFHCWHPTGKKQKKLAQDHGKYGKIYHLLFEEECCKCGKKRWVREIIDPEWGGLMTYTEEQITKRLKG